MLWGEFMRGNSYSIIKEANRQLLLNTIQEKGPMSVADLLHSTRLSRPTVETLLRVLQEECVLEEYGRTNAGVGRSAKTYSICTHHFFSIGVDFEYPSLRISAVNLNREAVYSDAFVFPKEMVPDQIVRKIVSMIHDVIDHIPSEPSPFELLGIGVGISGLIDRRNRESIKIERIPGWEHVRLPELLEAEFGIPVHMRNDVHMLAWINENARSNRGMEDYLYISMRRGIGMAMFIRKKMYSGTLGNAGFFGHTTIDINGPLCCCGNRGCLETYLSPVQMVANYALLSQQSISYEELLARFQSGDVHAREVFHQAYCILGKAISNVLKITDMKHIVISGLPRLNTNQLVQWIHEGINSNSMPDASGNVLIETEELKGQEAVGAGIYILKHFFVDPKLVVKPEELQL